MWLKNDGWKSRDNDKAEAEHFPRCQKGGVAETNHSDPSEHDSKFCSQKYLSLRVGTGGGLFEHGNKSPRSIKGGHFLTAWAISVNPFSSRFMHTDRRANGWGNLYGRSAGIRKDRAMNGCSAGLRTDWAIWMDVLQDCERTNRF